MYICLLHYRNYDFKIDFNLDIFIIIFINFFFISVFSRVNKLIEEKKKYVDENHSILASYKETKRILHKYEEEIVSFIGLW